MYSTGALIPFLLFVFQRRGADAARRAANSPAAPLKNKRQGVGALRAHTQATPSGVLALGPAGGGTKA